VGSPLPDETRAYVAKLANLLGIELSPTWIEGRQWLVVATPFVERADLIKADDQTSNFAPPIGTTTAVSPHGISQLLPRATDVFVIRSDAGASR
jgi:hypothetical protein